MRVVAAVTLVLVLGVSGCGSVSAPATTTQPAGATTPSTSPCPTLADASAFFPAQDAQGTLPDDFVPTAVIECVVASKPFAGEGVWSVMQERQARSGIEALVTAMRLPSQPTPAQQACDASLVVVPWFGFLDANRRWLRVDVPRDSCGKPLGAVLTALGALTFTTLHETRLHQDLTPDQATLESEATALGCTTQFKDMIAIVDADPGQPQTDAGSVLVDGRQPTALCRFSAGKDSDGMPMLTFVAGQRPTAAQGAALAAGLEAGGPVRPCSTIHTSVVGLFTAANDWVLVELDGCHRTYGGSTQWRQAAPALLAALS
jgi:hypothetical protein